MYSDKKIVTGGELNETKQNLIIDLRSLLCSSKDGLSDRELKQEYRNLTGNEVPHVTLGYNKLYDLMIDLPEVCSVRRHHAGNTFIYYAVHNETTRNLAQLVRGQMDPRKGVRERRRANEYFRNPTTPNTNLYNNNNSIIRNGKQSTYYFSTSKNIPSTQQRLNAPYSKTHQVPGFVQKKIQTVLSFEPHGKMSNLEFERDYKTKYGYLFDWEEFGFESARELLEFLTDLIQVEPSRSNQNEYFIKLIKSELNDEKSSTKKISVEEEMIANLKSLIKNAGSSGIKCWDLVGEYKRLTGKTLDLDQVGYMDLMAFLNDKLAKFVTYKVEPITNETCLIFKEDNAENEAGIKNASNEKTQLEESGTEEVDRRLKELSGCVERALRNQATPSRIEVDAFYVSFERRNGWPLDFKEYGFKSRDQLTLKLVELGLLNVKLFDHHKYYITYEERKKEASKTIAKFPATKSSLKENEKLQMSNANFIQDYIVYRSKIDSTEVLKQMAAKKSHQVVVSHVFSAINLQVQLVENVAALNCLMDELDRVYNGIGASVYDMPESYIRTGHVCAAIFPMDKNWHRGLIQTLYGGRREACVVFIDYGGYAMVPYQDIKFLAKEFKDLPAQAVNARLANLKSQTDWGAKEVNYFLNRVVNKSLTAEIFGFNEGAVSLELYDVTTKDHNGCLAGTKINLNQRVVMDGFAIKYNESNDIEFVDFEKWQNQVLSREKQTSPQEDGHDLFEEKFENALKKYNESKVETIAPEAKEPLLVDLAEEEEVPLEVKKKTISLENNEGQTFKFSLIAFQNEIYVHWTQVAKVFKFNQNIFKRLLLDIVKNNDNISFVKSVKFSLRNELIFDLIKNDLNIDLDKMGEEDEVWLIVYKKLPECAECMLDESGAKQVKELLKRNKSKGAARSKSESTDLSESFSKLCPNAELARRNRNEDSEYRNDIFTDQLNQLVAYSYYLEDQMRNQDGDEEKIRRKLEKLERTIEFYQSMLKQYK